jgi:two-component system KDP operon response regulator KdpE
MPTKLLVIDDDPAITEMLELVLPPEGFDVLSANSGPGGIEASKNWTPEIIVLDLMMPDIDGWQVCKKIRTFSEVPILVLSAIVDSGAISRAMEAGASDYLVKPAPLNKLLSHLRKLLQQENTLL